MKTLHKFEFGTIVCNGCGCRIDSRDDECEILRDIEDMLDYWLVSKGWKEYKKGKWYCKECAEDPSHRKHPNEGKIIREREILYGLLCDNCGREFEDYEGLSRFTDFNDTIERAKEDDWNEWGDMCLCPDCWDTCKSIKAEERGEDGEGYCIECPCRADCNEIDKREVPETSYECEIAILDSEGRYGGKCPHFHQEKNLKATCSLPAGEECPRLKNWKMEKEKAEKRNEEVEKWAEKK